MKHRVKMVGKISPTALYIALDRNEMQFIPGNCVEITNPNTNVKRCYSIGSSPRNESTLEFYIRIFPSDTGVSQYLSKLKVGDTVSLSEPFGYFYPGRLCEDRKFIYIATGTGIAPFASALDFYDTKPQMLLYGAKTNRDLIEPWRWQDKGIDCRFAVSQEETQFPKRITEYLKYLPVQDQSIKYFLCGIDSMIDDVSRYLTDHGISWDQIQVEQFYQSK